MLGDQGQGVLHRSLPAVHGLAGQAVDQIQRDVVQLGLPGGRHRLVHLSDGVGAVDGLQLLGAAGLHPQRQAVDPRLPQAAQGTQVHAVRVCLHRDLCVLLHLKKLAQGGEQLLDAPGPVPAGGAPAEIDGVYRDALGQGRSLPDVGQQRLLIGVHPVLPPRQGVEVAVVALAPAEGDMDVNAQLVRLSGLSLSHGAALLMISKVL